MINHCSFLAKRNVSGFFLVRALTRVSTFLISPTRQQGMESHPTSDLETVRAHSKWGEPEVPVTSESSNPGYTNMIFGNCFLYKLQLFAPKFMFCDKQSHSKFVNQDSDSSIAIECSTISRSG